MLVSGTPQHTYALPGRPDAPQTGDDLDGRLRIEIRDGQALVRVALKSGEALWGAGQRLDAYNLRGRTFDIWAEDGWNRWDTSYLAVPWFISSDGYGIFVNGTGRLRADVGASVPDELRIWSPDAGAEVWVFRGTPREILAQYSALVGRPHALPDWTFQPWLSRNSYLSAYEINRALRIGAQHGFRFGAVVLEAWAEQLHNFRFEERRYPEPEKWIAGLRKRGVHVVTWITPSVWTSSSAYAEAKSNDWLVRNDDGTEYVTRWLENGRKIDFRQEAARAWWRDLQRPLVRMGVCGFKTDGGEHMPDPWFHNEHPFHYQRATMDAFATEGRAGLAFARSGNPLTAGNSTLWGGDQHAAWSNLTAVVRAGLSAAWSGHFYWSHDVGGYTGTPEPELYVRWLQLGAFSPMFQLHGVTPREPWRFGAKARAIALGYFKARERLQPYLLELAAAAREQGHPMWRPLSWAFPDDVETHGVGDQFMLGPELLVAPVVEPVENRFVYFPAGEWVDCWDGAVITGPVRRLVRADLARMPVYARAESARRWRNLLADVPRGVIPPDEPPPAALPIDVNWRVLGWLPGGVASEQLFDGQRPHLNQVGLGFGEEPRRWVDLPPTARRTDDGALDLAAALGNRGFATAYLYGAFENPARQRVRIYVGSGDAATLWINEKQALHRPVHRNPEADEDSIDVTLPPGPVRLLLRISRDLAEPLVYVRIVAI